MKGREIERKFLLKSVPSTLRRAQGHLIHQGYLVTNNEGRHVRLRKRGARASLTFKAGGGVERQEHEIALTSKQFNALWPATAGRRLRKVRYEVKRQGLVIEIDVYRGRNQGLIVAEVEFPNRRACQRFKPPEWFGPEVTGNKRYSNIRLATE